jgi:hypothetical protein
MGLDIDEARRLLSVIDGAQARSSRCRTVTAATFAVRLPAAREVKERFDERLPLYGWLEDVDFGGQLAGIGRIDKLTAARGVHLGIKQGRQSAVRLGYSQIANPTYLSRKAPAPGLRPCTS